jgi:hypothetical protein
MDTIRYSILDRPEITITRYLEVTTENYKRGNIY